MDTCFNLSCVDIQEWNYWIICNSIFNFLRNRQIVFQSSCTIVHSCQQYLSSNSFTSLSTLVIICLFDYSRHMDVKWYPIVASIFISLMTNDVEHFSCAY